MDDPGQCLVLVLRHELQLLLQHLHARVTAGVRALQRPRLPPMAARIFDSAAPSLLKVSGAPCAGRHRLGWALLRFYTSMWVMVLWGMNAIICRSSPWQPTS